MDSSVPSCGVGAIDWQWRNRHPSSVWKPNKEERQPSSSERDPTHLGQRAGLWAQRPRDGVRSVDLEGGNELWGFLTAVLSRCPRGLFSGTPHRYQNLWVLSFLTESGTAFAYTTPTLLYTVIHIQMIYST